MPADPQGLESGAEDAFPLLIEIEPFDHEVDHRIEFGGADRAGQVALKLDRHRQADDGLDFLVAGANPGELFNAVGQARNQHRQTVHEGTVDIEQNGIVVSQRQARRH